MLNVYLDPSSYRYLSNKMFKEDMRYHGDDFFLPWRYLKKYCLENGINLNTIDFWKKEKLADADVYFTIDHKSFFRRLYWHFMKNKNYPVLGLDKFKKKILFQFEPPLIMPDVYAKINSVIKSYTKAYFYDHANFALNKKLECGSLLLYQSFNKGIPEYWQNSDRKFLTIIGTNKSAIPFKKLLAQIFSGFRPIYIGYKELLSERIKIIDFFSKNKEIDVYGHGWDKRPFFPYWFYKKSIQGVYRGPVDNRLEKLSGYKFAIAFENSIVPGFITERIFDCFYSGTIPIYLGAPDVAEYIPKNCFIDMRNFKNYEELRNFLKSLSDSEIETYRKNIINFFASEKFKPFSKEYFAEAFVKAVKE